MVQAMDADFEATVHQALTQCVRDGIISCNKIEGGAETMPLFQFRELHALFKGVTVFDVVGQNKSEFFPIRPPGPSFRRGSGIRVDRPVFRMQNSFPIDIIPPQLNLQPPGDEEFEGMVGFVEEHRFERSWIVTSKRFINEPDFIQLRPLGYIGRRRNQYPMNKGK